MKIKLKLFASLQDYLPSGSDRHVADLEIQDGETAMDVALHLNIPKTLVHLVVIDGTTLAEEEIPNSILREGQTLAIFPPLAGG